jgi:P27 family predicted phage terminase small subunit
MGGRGSGGKNKKPTALKKVQGNAGHRALNDKEPEPAPGAPKMPADLSRKAQIEWKRLVPILQGMKVLTEADGDALAALCTARVRWRQAEDLIERMGQVVVEDSPNGKRVKKNPAVTVASDALRHMRSLMQDFGLTPASRSGIKVDNGKSQDPMDDFFSGKAADEVVQ